MFNVNTLKLAVRDLAIASVLDELEDRDSRASLPAGYVDARSFVDEAVLGHQRTLLELVARVGEISGPLDWARLRDDTPEKLTQLIEAKLEGRQVPVAEEEPVQVLQLLDALKQSVAQTVGKKGCSPGTPTRTRKRRSA